MDADKQIMYEDLLNEWQNRLGLQDWAIKLNGCCTPEEVGYDDVVGHTDWTETSKAAKIWILDPKYYGQRIRPFDWEKTLVHELLHLKMCLLATDVPDLQERVAHILIDDLSRAFVDAKRSGSHEM